MNYNLNAFTILLKICPLVLLVLLCSSCADDKIAGGSAGTDNPAIISLGDAPMDSTTYEISIFYSNQNPVLTPKPLYNETLDNAMVSNGNSFALEDSLFPDANQTYNIEISDGKSVEWINYYSPALNNDIRTNEPSTSQDNSISKDTIAVQFNSSISLEVLAESNSIDSGAYSITNQELTEDKDTSLITFLNLKLPKASRYLVLLGTSVVLDLQNKTLQKWTLPAGNLEWHILDASGQIIDSINLNSSSLLEAIQSQSTP